MDIPTRNLSNYVKNTGTNISKMARDTGIPYMALYDSLMNPNRDRELRAGELFKVCGYLKREPSEFAGDLLSEKKGGGE